MKGTYMLPQTLWIPNTEHHNIARVDHGQLTDVDRVIIHINDGTTAGTLSWWAQPTHEADAAHLQIGKTGLAYQVARLNDLLWHCPPVNATSIGIEHEGYSRAEPQHAHDPHPEVQMHASANRCAWIHHECALGRPHVGHTIFPHSEFPEGGHPNCPGPWDWDLYQHLTMTAYMAHWGRK